MPGSEVSEVPADDKRSIDRSRAAALEWKKQRQEATSNKKRPTPSVPAEDAETPGKKAKIAAGSLEESRDRARAWKRQSLDTGVKREDNATRQTADTNVRAVVDSTSDDSDMSEEFSTMSEDPPTFITPAAVATHAELPPTPPMPEVSQVPAVHEYNGTGSQPQGSDEGLRAPLSQGLPPSERIAHQVNAPPSASRRLPASTRGAGLSTEIGNDTFLSHGLERTGQPLPSRIEPVSLGGRKEPSFIPPKPGRRSFLEHGLKVVATQEAVSSSGDNVCTTVLPDGDAPDKSPADVDADADEAIVLEAVAGVGSDREKQSSSVEAASIPDWMKTGLVVLAPLLLSGLLMLVAMPAWPYVHPMIAAAPKQAATLQHQVASTAKAVWKNVPAFFGSNRGRQKTIYFLAKGEDPSVCGDEVDIKECPTAATCGQGRILSCDVPFEMASDGQSCEMNAALRTEVGIVVKALREQTIKQQGWGGIFTMLSSSKSSVPLAKAATMAATDKHRGGNLHDLSLLASLPAGEIGGLIYLEGRPSPEFGVGRDNARIVPGIGIARAARLTDAALADVPLSLEYRARLWLGKKAKTYWKLLLTLMVAFTAILCRDVYVKMCYERHVKVCFIRNSAYKTLLDHSNKTKTPMPVSQIQDAVADEMSVYINGTFSDARKTVGELWPCVLPEVRPDTRIRMPYQALKGQRSVQCWEWIGPNGTTSEDIQPQSPRTPSRLWILPAIATDA